MELACWRIWTAASGMGGCIEQGGAAGWLTTAGNKPGMISRMGALLVEECLGCFRAGGLLKRVQDVCELILADGWERRMGLTMIV